MPLPIRINAQEVFHDKTKYCSKCKKRKFIDQFSVNVNMTSGYASQCKMCHRGTYAGKKMLVNDIKYCFRRNVRIMFKLKYIGTKKANILIKKIESENRRLDRMRNKMLNQI